MIVQDRQKTLPQKEISSHLIKCVVTKPEFLDIEGKRYVLEVKTRTLEMLVGELTQQAVLEMLQAMGMGAWNVVDWWPVLEWEPQF
jgi:hypothetical protein